MGVFRLLNPGIIRGWIYASLLTLNSRTALTGSRRVRVLRHVPVVVPSSASRRARRRRAVVGCTNTFR